MTIATLLIALFAVPTNADGAREPIMLDFTAAWCGPCRQMRPVVDELVQKGYPIKAVDVDRSPDLAERYRVTGVPAFIVIDPSTGRELGRTEGARDPPPRTWRASTTRPRAEVPVPEPANS